MRKTGKVLLYILLIMGGMMVLYHRIVLDFIGHLMTSREGVLLSLFHHVARYFKHADSLNLIFLTVFLCVSLVGFVVIDKALMMIFNWLTRKRPIRSRILFSSWITQPAQKILSLFILGIGFILICNFTIIIYGELNSTDLPDKIKPSQPVLVLGTGKHLSSGKGENLYYTYRIKAALRLWKLNKVSYFIASGDRSGEHYDETRDIMTDLVAGGVPPERIKRDTAGYRTLDSMLRIREMYRTRDIVIVTQAFHAQRALFLARFYGMRATAFKAQGRATKSMVVREFFSKPKVVMDLVLFNMQPKVFVTKSPGPIQYREAFQVTSDLHVIFLLVLTVAVLSTLGLTYRYLD